MAETISREGTTVTPVAQYQSNLTKGGTSKQGVFRGAVVSVDAAPSDTTLYTVPAGKLFLCNAIVAQKQDAPGNQEVMDSAGDTSSGASKCLILMGQKGAMPPIRNEFNPPIAFQKGITIDSTMFTASKDHEYQIMGYLV